MSLGGRSKLLKEQFMKELNILVDNVANNFLPGVILQNTEENFMRESNILAEIVAKNFLTREIFQNTEQQFMKE